ncbi:unnamed protein product [Pedinophyceae sp. YPF-701]|nr:unnamed protein product [Pedinophyceae sp. YPF-701]
MSSDKARALGALLDREDDDIAPAAGDKDVEPTGDVAQRLHEEHVKRERAEAEAQHKAQMLRVAQQQIAEWAQERSRDAAELAEVSRELRDGLQASTADPALMTLIEKLVEGLQHAASDAGAVADQQREDVAAAGGAGLRGEEDGKAGGMEVEGVVEGNGNGAAEHDEDSDLDAELEAELAEGGDVGAVSFAERARWIPLRLNMDERRLLRLLEGALSVSEYTDKVDILTWKSKAGRINKQVRYLCSLLCALVVAEDYNAGQRLIKDRDFEQNADFFQACFEVGRRYKVMNPDKMRSDYGKLMYMLMDSCDPQIEELLGFECVKPLLTVGSFLDERGGARLLEDPLMETATAEIVAANRPRPHVQADIKRKEAARSALARKYKTARLTEDEILWCIYSISDNNSYLFFNRDPVDKMITMLTTYFRPDQHTPQTSLAISSGRGGARLSHSHERQYNYVLQSLTLWREVSTDMFKLWCLAESDLLRSGNRYRLCDTGQGLNRVQQAPATYRAMTAILARCQLRIGHWVGSSVVHLGDHNVPNAFMFIDKYTQVPRILNPVTQVLEEVPRLCANDPHVARYVSETFGSPEGARVAILQDFFRHAFDGSGADNFFDAGSCIDGRLTSAWNWCSKLEKKAYFHLFRLAGFHTFDGDWQK